MSSGTKATNDIALTSFDPIDVKSLIYVMRNQQVMLDSDLAMLYDVETKVFNQAVRRNENRFPERFRFRLTSEEYERLRSQTVTSNSIIVFLLVLLPKLLFIHNSDTFSTVEYTQEAFFDPLPTLPPFNCHS